MTVFKDILVGSNFHVYYRYWYKQLNINSSRLNRQGTEDDQIRLIEISRKNQLSEDEKQKMLSNGFNDKYIVQNYSTRFEEVPLKGLKERLLYWGYLFVVGVLLRFDFGKRVAKSIIESATRRTRSIRKQKVIELEKISDQRRGFAECPFAGSISTTSLNRALYEVEEFMDKRAS